MPCGRGGNEQSQPTPGAVRGRLPRPMGYHPLTDDRALTPDLPAEHERALLACALQNADTARELLALVQAPMIADAGLSRVWSALRRVLAVETGPVCLTAGGDAPGLVDLHKLARAVPSAANATYYARRVVDAYVRCTAAGMIGEVEAERNVGASIDF